MTQMTADKVKIIGGKNNFWIWSEKHGFDLTHPRKPSDAPVYPRIPLATAKEQATIDPLKTALVIVDMQNYFLSPLLVDKLLGQVIPACRRADIPIVWLGWGLEERDLDDMPPSIARGYAFPLDKNCVEPRFLGSLGDDIGQLKLDDGAVIEAGRVMMRDQWNTAFFPALVKAAEPRDIWINKNRLSGFWGGTGIEEALRERGIKTLLFSGENTDQCVAATMQDAYTKGWDCLMLSDGCATTSPEFATKCVEYNCRDGWGFVLTCQQLIDGIDNMQSAPGS